MFRRVARCYGTGEKPTGIYKGFYTGWPGARKYHELFSRKLLEIPRFFSFNSSTVKITDSILLISTELFVIYSLFFFYYFQVNVLLKRSLFKRIKYEVDSSYDAFK